MPKLRCGHLFNGIGGFQIAAYWAGWENVFHCEIDEFCNRVAARHFPESICHGDIKKENFIGYKGSIDVITGGFPCQPISKAGKRRGAKDARWLWPEYIRVVKEIEPFIVVVENVANLLKMGVEQIFDDLEAQGYRSSSYIIPATAMGAFHRRDRIWIIAIKENTLYPNADGSRSYREASNGYWSVEGGDKLRDKQVRLPGSLVSEGVRTGVDTRIFGATDGVSNRVDRLRAIGNAICPQVALEIFDCINEIYDKL